MLYEPGDHWRYTQSGINVAARIVEVTSGLSYDDFVSKRILKPLGMKNTTFYPNKKQRSHLATPYIKDKQTGTLTAAPYANYGNKGQPPSGTRGFSYRPGLCALLPDAVERRHLQRQALSQPGCLSTAHHRAHRRTQDRFPANRQNGNRGMNYGWGIGVAILKTPHPGVAEMLFAGHLRSWRSLGHPGLDRPGPRSRLHPHGAAPGVNGDASKLRQAFQQAASDAYPQP